MTQAAPAISPAWKWSVCAVLFLSTMLNYMDRQTLSQTALRIKPELGIDAAQYGILERDFGFAFAMGGLFFGFLADRVKIFWLYPLIILIWSIIGYGTAYCVEIGQWLGAGGSLSDPARGPSSLVGLGATPLGSFAVLAALKAHVAEATSEQAFLGLRVCRAALGFTEAAQWPFALVTTSRLLTRAERSLGNSILQSGTAIGSIVTPIIVQVLVTDEPGTWRRAFMVIGVVGVAWLIPWFALMRPSDLSKPAPPPVDAPTKPPPSDAIKSVDIAIPPPAAELPQNVLLSRIICCVAMVICINLPWHFLRAWLPQFLQGHHGYSMTTINFFTAGFYIASDVGCIGIGVWNRYLTASGWDVHRSRAMLFGLCSVGVSLAGLATVLPGGPLLMIVLLIVGAAGLAVFPLYYSFSQDISGKHQGKVSGTLGCTTWLVTAMMQWVVGLYIEETGSFVMPMVVLSFAPLAAFMLLLLVWKQWPPRQAAA